MEVVKVFNKEGESYEKFRSAVMNYRDFTLKWFKACWPWMAGYGVLIPCTLLLTLPLGSYFVLMGYASIPDFILILCLVLSVGIPLLRTMSFVSLAIRAASYKNYISSSEGFNKFELGSVPKNDYATNMMTSIWSSIPNRN